MGFSQLSIGVAYYKSYYFFVTLIPEIIVFFFLAIIFFYAYDAENEMLKNPFVCSSSK